MGRTLDYEFSYGEQITITPRNYEFDFRFAGKIKSHYALIGMAFVAGGYPLYYDAVNEKGLGMAGLNFVGNATYEEALPEDETEVSQVAQFEFIPYKNLLFCKLLLYTYRTPLLSAIIVLQTIS